MERPTRRFGRLLADLDTRRGRATSYLLYLLNVVFLALYIAGTYEATAPYRGRIVVVEFGLALLFLFEYLARLDHAEDTVAEATSLYSVADLVAILPALLIVVVPAVGQLAFLRGVQVLRVLRFVRLGLADERFFNYDLTARQVTVAELLVSIFVVLNVHAGLVYAFESGANPAFPDYGAALYYSVVALTTTGFGNTVPVTPAGKVATSLGLVAAVTLIPWLVVRARRVDEGDAVCDRCDTTDHCAGANYCWKCGTEL